MKEGKTSYRIVAAAAAAAAVLGIFYKVKQREEAPIPLGQMIKENHEQRTWEQRQASAKEMKVSEQKQETEDGEIKSESGGYQKPVLPAFGDGLSDFIPEGWELLDSVELDFNEDQQIDYVGVLELIENADKEALEPSFYPRILFAIACDAPGQYTLDFQDENLIRSKSEGGVFGDPYEPLTAENNSFSTHAYGGSAWRWSERFTYTYKEGNWYLTASEESYGYGTYVTKHSLNDYEKGVGIREERSDAFEVLQREMEEMEEGREYRGDEFDLIYEVALDTPVTLDQFSMRWFLSPERSDSWAVKDIVTAEGVKLEKKEVQLPDNSYIDFTDENCILYEFTQNDSSYLALYQREDELLYVLAREDTAIEDAIMYQDKIYYSCEWKEDISYRDSEGNLVNAEETAGVKLYRINPDGTGRQEIFKYRIPEGEEGVLDTKPYYMWLTCEITGNEIIAEVYDTVNNESLFYRMNPDGSGAELIGSIQRD